MSNARQLAANLPREGGLSNRNMVINGACVINQRGSALSLNSSTTYGFPVDRFDAYLRNMDQAVVGVSQSNDAPEGFSKSIKVEVTTPETTLDSGGGEYLRLGYRGIEGQDCQHLEYGTSNAKVMTLSFWVKSSLTGTYSVTFYNPNPTPSRHATIPYTVDVADTWEKKTILVPADTSQATSSDNTLGIQVNFVLAASGEYTGSATGQWKDYEDASLTATGSVNFLGQVGTFRLTGLQLEVGDSSTPFEHRSYHDQLRACQRYFEGGTYANASASGYAGQFLSWRNDSTTRAFPFLNGDFKVSKRSVPTVTFEGGQTGAASEISGYSSGTNYTVSYPAGLNTETVCRYINMVDTLPAQALYAYYQADAEF